jgi:hypothetical protein
VVRLEGATFGVHLCLNMARKRKTGNETSNRKSAIDFGSWTFGLEFRFRLWTSGLDFRLRFLGPIRTRHATKHVGTGTPLVTDNSVRIGRHTLLGLDLF